MEIVKVGLVGLGTIGTGVADLLLNGAERMSLATGTTVQLAKVVDKDVTSTRDIEIPSELLTDNLDELLNDPEISVVVQLIGGTEPARSIMVRILESGKDVVTANKALLAVHGRELFSLARKLGRSIAFEAAIGGGIPIINAIGCSLQANAFESLLAILNGTSNFILSQMEELGVDYASAVAEAQRLGFAEADPSMDVNGTDAAQKLAILAQLAFRADVDWDTIPRSGIDSIQVEDLRYANELGYSIKLLAVADMTEQGLELHVSPTLVSQRSPMSKVRNAYNAVRVKGNAVGSSFFHGLGAGREPTASAVVGDVLDTIVGRAGITFQALNLWGEGREAATIRDPKESEWKYYFRFQVDNAPGVLAEISGILAQHHISIASVIQHETPDAKNGTVPLVIMTHAGSEGSLMDAADQLDRLEQVRVPLVRMRVHE